MHPPTAEALPQAEPSGAALRRQVLFWVGAFVVFVLFVLVFSSILLPFVAGLVLAYFLDPVADWLERRGLSRLWATIVILFAFVMMLVVGIAIFVPVLINQGADFAEVLPEYIAKVQGLVTSFDPGWLARIGIDPANLRESLSGFVSQGAGVAVTLVTSLWNSGKAIVDIAGLFVVTPVVAFYMLLDWDRMVARIDALTPRDHVATVRQIARDVNASTAGFVRGQGTLCLILGAYYAIGLSLLGLNFGLLIGFFAGIISFIPFVGSLVGLVLAVGVALVQFWPDWIWVVAVACVFFSGQFIEGNILQPKLVGESVGLHPVWLMFALFAFGYLFGFVGLLIAVPAAAAVAVLVRFAVGRYLDSPMYRGRQMLHLPPTDTTRTLDL